MFACVGACICDIDDKERREELNLHLCQWESIETEESEERSAFIFFHFLIFFICCVRLSIYLWNLFYLLHLHLHPTFPHLLSCFLRLRIPVHRQDLPQLLM